MSMNLRNATLVGGLSPGTSYWYRLRARNVGGTSTYSNSVSVTPTLITVTSPNSISSWTAGSKQTINWTYSGTPGPKVKIELLKSGSTVATITTSTAIGSIWNSSYVWTLKQTLPGGSDYQVRVTSTTNSTYTGTSSYFTVAGPAVSLTSPNGDEKWTAGGKYPITWSYTGSPGNVRIDLLENGNLYSTIKTSTSAGSNGSGSYTWTIPKTHPTGNDYQVRITAVADSACSASSKGTFSIAGPTITVTSPNGGEKWTAGGKYPITWSYTGSPSNVRIDLLENGNLYSTIKTSTSAGSNGSGSYTWIIPKTHPTGNDYQVRITAVAGSACSASSKGTFSIAGPKFTVTSPNGGEKWMAGGKYPITWSYTGRPGNVRIDLFKSGVLHKNIKSSVSIGDNGSGSYTWTIPKTLSAGSDYLVGIASTANSACTGLSQADFSIGGMQASAGPDQLVRGATVVSLNSLNSTGVIEDSTSYNWTQKDGPPVALSDPKASETIFMAPEAAEGKSLRFQLSVTYSNGVSSEDSCIVNVSEDTTAPIAEAGPNRTAASGEIVTLDGSQSAASGSIVSYSWQQLSGSPVALADASAMRTTFVAPVVGAAGGSFIFELTVTDEEGLRSRDTCIVSVVCQKLPPMADAGPNQTVRPGTRVVLDGTGSTDQDGAVATYRWKQISGTPVMLSDPAHAIPSFIAPTGGEGEEKLVFQLLVTDAGGLEDSAKTTVVLRSPQFRKK